MCPVSVIYILPKGQVFFEVFSLIALRSDLLSRGKFWRFDVNFVGTNLFRQSIKIDFNLNYFSFTELLGLFLEKEAQCLLISCLMFSKLAFSN